MDNITVNMKNLSDDEREQLMKLIEKSNKIENEVWKPKKDKLYYSIYQSGYIGEFVWKDDSPDNNIFAIGNCFKTEEEAEFQVERLKVLAEMKRIAAKEGEDRIWDGNTRHYTLEYNCVSKFIFISSNSLFKYNAIYFISKEIAQECIDTIGEERLKKYYFQVKE